MRPAPRCLLFVPAHVDKMRSKAQAIAVDAIVLDLEDAVPPAMKTTAQTGARQFIGLRPDCAFVRINALTATTVFSTGGGREDIEAVVRPGIRGIVLPKVESAQDVTTCDAALRSAEMRHGVVPGTTELYAIVETARGVCDAVAIARAAPQRPFRLCFGAGDFTTDIGVDWSRDEEESRVARGLIVLASRAAGLGQPVDSVFNDVSDTDGLARSAELAKQLGFCGKFVIHPTQVAPVARAFTPSDAEAAWAQEVIARLAEAERSGAGAFIVNGKMIDYPIVEKARRLLAAWEAASGAVSASREGRQEI